MLPSSLLAMVKLVWFDIRVLVYAGCPQSWPLKCSSLTGCFNGHFPSEPRLAGVYWSKGWWRWCWQLDYWSYKSRKAPVRSSPPTNQHPVFFTGRMPYLTPNQQCQSTEGKNITFHGLAYPNLTWGLPTCLTTNSSWLPWGRVVMPLLSPLMPVRQPLKV